MAEKVKEIYRQVLDEIKDDHLIKKYDLSSAAIVNELKKYEIRQGMIEFNQTHLNKNHIDTKYNKIKIPVRMIPTSSITLSQAETIKKEIQKNKLNIIRWNYRTYSIDLPIEIGEMELIGIAKNGKRIWIKYNDSSTMDIEYSLELGELIDKLAEILGIETEPKVFKKVVK